MLKKLKSIGMGKYILYIGVALGVAYIANYTGFVEVPFFAKPPKTKEIQSSPVKTTTESKEIIPAVRMIEPEKKDKKESSDSTDTTSDSQKKVYTGEVVYVRNNNNAHAVSGQVMIRVSELTRDSAYIELTLPSMKIYRLPDMQVGARVRFESNKETYFLDFLEVYNKTAKIKITKRA